MTSLLDHPWELGFLMAVLMAVAIECGYQAAVRVRIHQNADRKDQMFAIRDGLFVLVSLLLGFTLALATPRYAERRSLLIDEANAIGTTYLRAGTLPEPIRGQTQQLLRHYVDSRIELDNSGLDVFRRKKAIEASKRIQAQLWQELTEITQTDRSAISASYMHSVNQAIDLHEKRLSSLENRIPSEVWLLIIFVSMIAAFARGLTIGQRFWMTLVLAPLTIAIVIALVADIDAPNSGLIRLDRSAMHRIQMEINGQQ